MQDYIFTSQRLGFRSWREDDLDWFATLCADPQVMKYFPKPLDRAESLALIKRLIALYQSHHYTYYPVELIQTKSPIGFIGIAYQDYLEDLPPWTDIGWRLHPHTWGKGLATEGAEATLKYATNRLKLNTISAVAPRINHASINVMTKIGMSHFKTFHHPKLSEYANLEECVMYQIKL